MDAIKPPAWFPTTHTEKPFTIDAKAGNALLLRGQRLSVLVANMANADTPNYKARDFDFQMAFAQANEQAESLPLVTDASLHLNAPDEAVHPPELLYRVPYQASLDGNTVEMAVEQAAFAENVVDYQYELQAAGSETKDVIDLFNSLK
jgi:flagellar basal-body rod protein FlgB